MKDMKICKNCGLKIDCEGTEDCCICDADRGKAMESELPAIDALIDTAICYVRDRLVKADQDMISDFMDAFVEQNPSMTLAGLAYHLGLLVVTRANCARDEFDQSLVADEIERLEAEAQRLRRKLRDETD